MSLTIKYAEWHSVGMDNRMVDRYFAWAEESMKPSFGEILTGLLKRAQDEVASSVCEELKAFEGHSQPRYDEHSPELVLWTLGLILETWCMEILRRKATEGHCFDHPKPCRPSQKFHARLFTESAQEFEAVVNLIRNRPLPAITTDANLKESGFDER